MYERLGQWEDAVKDYSVAVSNTYTYTTAYTATETDSVTVRKLLQLCNVSSNSTDSTALYMCTLCNNCYVQVGLKPGDIQPWYVLSPTLCGTLQCNVTIEYTTHRTISL
jgi:hypothetical protein